jgi:hypothetical protein
VLAAGAAIALALSIQASVAQASTCAGSSKCLWLGSYFSGEEVNVGCVGETTFTGELKSIKDNCGENLRIGWAEGGSTNWKGCVNSGGGESADPGRFNRVVPGAC